MPPKKPTKTFYRNLSKYEFKYRKEHNIFVSGLQFEQETSSGLDGHLVYINVCKFTIKPK